MGSCSLTCTVQDVPIRKIGKTSSQNFLNTATTTAGATPAGPPQWFAPAPTVSRLVK